MAMSPDMMAAGPGGPPPGPGGAPGGAPGGMNPQMMLAQLLRKKGGTKGKRRRGKKAK